MGDMDFSSDEEYRDITARAEECVLGNDWLSENIFKPAANVALVEPYNALADTTNKLSGKIIGCPLAGLKDHYEIKPAALFSPEWYAQTISGGAGAALPYAAAGLFSRSALLKAGEKIGAKSFTGRVLASQHTANILGAGTYDFLRVAREGETKVGNTIAGVAGFSLFETGNYAAARLSLPQALLTRSLTGALGANAQLILSRQIATGENPTQEELLHSTAGGVVLNNTLPGLQKITVGALVKSQMQAGKPVNIADYINHRFAQQEIADVIHAQIQENPLARVQEKPGINAGVHDRNLVLLDRNNPRQDKLGHELDHLVSGRAESTKAEYQAITELLNQGKKEEAWLHFRQLRLAQEQSATTTEAQITARLNSSGKLTGLPTAEKTLLPQEKPQNTLTYEQIWRAEFEKFAASKGKTLPQIDHALAYHADVNWNERLANYHKSSLEEKLEMLKETKQAPESLQNALWSKLVKDPEQQIRISTIAQIDAAPLALRPELFYAAIHHPDYFTRTAGIAQLASLPAASREKAFLHVLNQKSVLTSHDLSVDMLTGEHKKLPLPEWLKEKQNKSLRQLVSLPAEQQLAKELSGLPPAKRLELWSRMLEDGREPVRLAASKNIEPLAPANRLSAWTRSFDRNLSRSYCKPAVSESLAENIKHLDIQDRAAAWAKLTDPAVLKGHSHAQVAKGLKHLPEDMRLPAWLELCRTMDTNQPRHGWQDSSLLLDRHGLIAAISHLKPENRAAILQFAAKEFHNSHLPDLLGVIKDLPEKNRLEALVKLSEGYINKKTENEKPEYRNIENLPATGPSFQNYRTKWSLEMAVQALPASSLSDALTFIAQIENPELKTGLLESLPINKLSGLPVNQRLNILTEIFSKAADRGDRAINQELKSWFAHFEEANHFDEPPVPPYNTAEIKQHLIDTVSGDKLARIFLLTNDSNVATRFSRKHPEILRDFILSSNELSSSLDSENLAGIAQVWTDNSSLQEATGFALKHGNITDQGYTTHLAAPELLAAMAKHSPTSEHRQVLQDLSALVTDPHNTPNQMQLQLAIETASKLKDLNQDLANALFFKPVQNAISDPNRSYPWRLDIARHLASLQRDGKIDAADFQMPNLRMPEIEGLSALERESYRYKAEAALTNTPTLRKMLNDGMLGRLFPDVFGHTSKGGIFERPQHGGHDFILHEHILNVVERVHEHPEFRQLSEKDQTNVLWAALLHDVGKRPGTYDPHHEWASANMAWGVLGTLGYPPERIQRIANLISRHSEVSFNPAERVSERLQNNDFSDDMAVHYRHPNALRQLAILNEADIKSIATDSHHWTEEVSLELQTIRQMLNNRVDSLNAVPTPLLTSAMPKEFGLFKFQDDYAVLAHASDTIYDGKFLKHLSLIESPQYSISTSLLTPNHHHLYHDSNGLVALMKGPYENISQAHRSNLGTGTSVDWRTHIKLATAWEKTGKSFSKELDEKIAQVDRRLTVEKLYKRLAEFDNLDELQQQQSEQKQLLRAHQALVQALTTDEQGLPATRHNEVKLNNPTLAGFGILRKGNSVTFQDMPEAVLFNNVLQGNAIPHWLNTGRKVTPSTVTIPALVWQEAMRRRLPFMILDP